MKPDWTMRDALRAMGVLIVGSIFAAAVMMVGEELGLDLGSEDRAALLVGLFSTVCGMLLGLWYAHRRGGAIVFSWGLVSRRWMLAAIGFAVASLALGWGWGWCIEAIVGEVPDQQIIAQVAGLSDPLVLGVTGLYITVGAPVMEEYLFRGFFQAPFVERFGRWGGIAITATAFGLMHVSDPWVVPGVILIGCVAGWLREETGGVGVPIAFHAANNSLALVLYALFGVS